MRATVSNALPGTRDALDADLVQQAVARVRRETMLRAQTAAGLVGVVGRAMEVGGDPLAAARYLDTLSAVDSASIRDYMDRLIRSGPVRAEVHP